MTSFVLKFGSPVPPKGLVLLQPCPCKGTGCLVSAVLYLVGSAYLSASLSSVSGSGHG